MDLDKLMPRAKAGELLSRFLPVAKLERLLGSGSFGIVYLADDGWKQTAVKFTPISYRLPEGLSPEERRDRTVGWDWQRLMRHRHELDHPVFVQIRDFYNCDEEDPESPVATWGIICMDYWPWTLRTYLKHLRATNTWTPVRRFTLLRNASELLWRLHAETGFVITDLKMDNILLREFCLKPLPMGWVDLGGLQRPGGASTTQAETTTDYLPPEYHRRQMRQIDETSMVYSFGLIAFYLLEGRYPFGAYGRETPFYRLLRDNGGPDWKGPAGSEAFRPVVERCLAEKRTDRYVDFHAVHAAIVKAEAARPVIGRPAKMPLKKTCLPGYSGEKLWQEPTTGMEFVFVPGGSFEMGQSEEEARLLKEQFGEEKYQRFFARELPRHKVSLDGYWIGRYPVTRGQFRCFTEETLHETDAEQEGFGFSLNDEGWGERRGVSWKEPGFPQEDDHPVVCLTWFDAGRYAAWMARRTGLPVALPSEAQWEYACRGGKGGAFSCGETISTDQANYDGRSVYGSGVVGAFRRGTTPVGQFAPNPFGLHDMHGNVWEWCADRYVEDFYGQKEASRRNPLCVGEPDYRVRRGGSWSFDPAYLRCSYRGRNRTDSLYSDIGFRLVI
ncbi:MAG: SUMF1/EgtB/PvdO family nonheme iron enzyme [Magnetococcales bacterium]|nr:SUMF1/EgtB/PvdO family nonheme iron enzyme [Magnetococcales bacterium]